ncbi:MAG: Nif3-like dinuclear metal center hexameric protein [Bacteroidetes bacterium]|nr:Nif3-like dinuclear metal center hexameric protein [Bacteroidota bacterium]MBU1485523.1 Nif3-like dinuclear metal center hexameric protein [Bacteroidota bacterium]MBU2269549.1 Nif3-like dinuclear metal center hexameric protein [Bacteroidota bacterium]MBU2375260.1 Nif3-like dinuclear metal center hexameric protein [Bacteroidota bacterium]
MIIAELTSYLEEIAPLNYQENYDNAGLIVGSSDREIKKALISLDCTEAIVDEAIQQNCDIIISHHPIVFKGLKKLNGNNYVERVIIKAIENKIAIYAIHTNLDSVLSGVNAKICEKIGLQNCQVLSPKSGLLKKLVFFVPLAKADEVKTAIFNAGAGNIGNYSECSFSINGFGTFKGNESSNPFVGIKNELHQENETRIEVIYPAIAERKILSALLASHPYEEVAHDIYSLDNSLQDVGSGMVGELENEMDGIDFLHLLKKNMGLIVIRHTEILNKKIKRIAVCGGSGSFLLKKAIQAKADVFVTADFKYHEFFDADRKILIADIGHFESEQFTQELLLQFITKKFPNFAVRLTENNTNPIKYLS